MSEPIAYGLDFGTTNSSISIAYDDGVEILEIDRTSVMPHSLPSISYLHRSGNRSAGQQAVDLFLVTGTQRHQCAHCELVLPDRDGSYSECRQYQQGGGCLDSRLIAGIKTELSNRRFTHTHSWATDFELQDLAAIVMGDLKRRADRHTGRPVRRAVLGHPVAFTGASGPEFHALQALAEDRLLEAAYRAGFDEVELFPEPAAAVLDEALPDGFAVSVDFGGGTFDVAVVEVDGGEGEVVALQGVGIGGSLFDALLFDLKMVPYLRLDRPVGRRGLPIPGKFRAGLRRVEGLRDLLSSPLTYGIVDDLMRTDPHAGEIVSLVLFGGQAHAFYKAIENAKIELSTSAQASIEFHPPGFDVSVPVTRAELDGLLRPHIEDVESAIALALDEAGIAPADVTTVIRTGGSSRLGAFIDMLDRVFGSEKVRSRSAFTSVAYGLGVAAQEVWR